MKIHDRDWFQNITGLDEEIWKKSSQKKLMLDQDGSIKILNLKDGQRFDGGKYQIRSIGEFSIYVMI